MTGPVLRCPGCRTTAPGTVDDPPAGWVVYTDGEGSYFAFCSAGCLDGWGHAVHEMIRDVHGLAERGGEV